MATAGWPGLTPGRTLIILGNLMYSVGAFVADWSDTHVFNPRWPPHAKFHNGQTMTLGVFLATSSTYFALRPTAAAATARDDLRTAAIIGTFYCLSGLSAILYPGTHWKDPETPGSEGGGQQHVFAAVCVAMWVGYWVDVFRSGDGSGRAPSLARGTGKGKVG
ncbi:hypothetical protein K431DRAFT_279322 [Polychaeton citri CBS 116435]|uniref:Uncharacterized protein n=1 Tax=Polychaeton citri CBS 116435 TaxID=1314669 RepID=A0A9P4Q0S5_9PEZI|nr:hypothetical protein K431DRAFT_279322 [Polychaeton citri CBS 116435]